jgi:hypothetical protein
MGLQIDLRSDIYACGCALFETLTGDPPFLSNTALATMLKHQTETPSTLKQATLGETFPEDLEYVVAKLLAKQPGERYQSMMALKHDLLAVKEGRPLDATSASKTISKSGRSKHVLAMAMAVAAIACTAIAGFLALYFASNSKPTQPPQPPSATVPKIVPAPVVQSPAAPNKLDAISFQQSEYFAKIPLEQAKGGPWVLSFPSDMWLGTLIARQKDGSTEKQAAQGLAHFPHAAPLEFNVRKGATELSRLFRKFRGDELRKITFGLDPFVTDDVLLTLDHLTGLRSLILTNCDITDQGMSYIANLPSLTELELGVTQVSGPGMGRMKWLKKLEIFQASHMKNISAFISAIQTSKSIRVLKLSRNHFAARDFEMLGHIPNLTALSVSTSNITDNDLQYLTKLKHLAALDVASCNITPAAIPYLKQMPALRTLGITTAKWLAADRSRLETALPLCRPARSSD